MNDLKKMVDENVNRIYEDIVNFEKNFEEILIRESLKDDEYIYEKDEEYIDEKDEEDIVIFFGISRYPNRKNHSKLINVIPFGIYQKYNFKEIAFLCYKEKLELYHIVGILCDSLDVASKLIRKLLDNGKMDIFAKYLWYEKKTLFINISNKNTDIDNLLGDYLKHKVMFCCPPNKISCYKNLNKNKTNKRYDCIFRTNHPGHMSYANSSIKSCKSYQERIYNDINSNLTIQSFKRL